MKKILKSCILVFITIFIIGCTTTSKPKEQVNAKVILPDGLPAIAVSSAISESIKLENINLEYSIQKTSDLLVSELMKGDADLAIIPSNLVLQANKKGLNYKIAATIGWGSFYLITTEDEITIDSLKGKEIYNTGKGLTPDIIFKKVLDSKNINMDEVNLSYVGAAAELAPIIAAGKAKYAVVPEPALSTVMSKNPKVKIIANLNDEWKNINDVEMGYPQSTLVIKEDFYNYLQENDLYDKMIAIFSNAEKLTTDNPEKVVDICQTLGITVNRETIKQTIENSNLKFTEANQSMDEYKAYFKVIDEENRGEVFYDTLFIKK